MVFIQSQSIRARSISMPLTVSFSGSTSKTLILRFGLKLEGLQSAQALAISPSGEIFIGDHNRGSLFQAKRGDRQPLKIINNGAFRTFWSLAIANDEKSRF